MTTEQQLVIVEMKEILTVHAEVLWDLRLSFRESDARRKTVLNMVQTCKNALTRADTVGL